MPSIPKLNKGGGDFYIGIDPGKSGGIACLCGGVLCEVDEMPENEYDILLMISDYCREYEPRLVVIEKVWGMKGQSASAAFTFGRGVGIIIAALMKDEVPILEVAPQRWQKTLGISSRKNAGGKLQFKKHLRDVARKLHPTSGVWEESQRKQLAVSDAILISHYAQDYSSGKNLNAVSIRPT